MKLTESVQPNAGLVSHADADSAAYQPSLPGLHFQVVQSIGPVPAPQVLHGYAQIDPSFPHRILVMAEQNAATERKTAERSQLFMLVEHVIARMLAFLFAAGAVYLSFTLAMNGHEGSAAIIGGTTLVAVAVALATGKRP